MMAAATVTDDSVRDAMIGLVYAYASSGQNNSGNNPLAVVYNAATSEHEHFKRVSKCLRLATMTANKAANPNDKSD